MFQKVSKFLNENFPIVLATVLLILILIGFFKIDLPGASVPCDDQSEQIACYHITNDICKKAWDQLESECEVLLPKVMDRPFKPSEIISPKIKKCQKVLFDKRFHLSRKINENSQCSDLFQYIEERKHDFE